MSLEEDLKRAADIINNAGGLLICAGAGIGVDSGLPDFRGTEGFWKAYPLIAKLGISFAEMANPVWFQRNPKLAWAFYGHRLNLYRETTPHKGFRQLLQIGEQKPGGYFVFTSNVDGQFQKGGYSTSQIEECHGSIHYFQCVRPCGDDIWDARDINVIVDEDRFEALEPLPRCENCGNMARPNVLMFGDWSWVAARTLSQRKRLAMWLKTLSSKNHSLAVVEIGAGEAVPTVRNQAEHLVRDYRARLIRINPRDYQVPDKTHVSLPLGGAQAVDGIYQKLRGALAADSV
ncbi:MAG: Sir2 family NAD-dependent protein deacetylase [Syntrophobacterales bacterium]|jgi:NAD-dependent SIR2 family protein deacetylase